jgi:hypothetical protein
VPARHCAGAGAITRRHQRNPAEADRRWRGQEERAGQARCPSPPHTLSLRTKSSAKCAIALLIWLRPIMSGVRRNRGEFCQSQTDAAHVLSVLARMPADILGIRPELHGPGAAAQTRTVSGGHFWPSKTAVITKSQIHSSNSAQTLISEFESYDPSHAVRSLAGHVHAEKIIARTRRGRKGP